MKIRVLSTNDTEAQGLKWLIESHLNGVEVLIGGEGVKTDCSIIDMGLWSEELETHFAKSSQPWIGISSDRTFLTAYRALKGKAEDLLFRPFDPLAVVKQLQQLRFQLRNRTHAVQAEKQEELVYEDFFSGTAKVTNVILAALVLEEQNSYVDLQRALKTYPFYRQAETFIFSDFILLAYFSTDAQACMEECSRFHADWRKGSDKPASILINANRVDSIKQYYQETRKLTSLIFYEGYDIVSVESGELQWQALDPFLSPLEQRIWVEMLERKETASIQVWMETELLAYRRPYPEPEMVRVRLTSVLAQVRRYMKSSGLSEEVWNRRYLNVFEEIVKGPVVYTIVQSTTEFIIELVREAGNSNAFGDSSIEKARELMETNYWNPDWNLTACAETLGMTRSTLSRRFQQETGRKFVNTLYAIRLREAKRLMIETDLALEEVARLTGFSNASYFSAVYRKYEHLTPTEFRQGKTANIP
ncbi:MAG TPA: helix-turn-helix domain-containing protein [Planococcus sp. (in: firmicutes)]|nr:helix-turn-helix domain-containing protein [Planococcus sp. (in: firmicutes)]